MDKDCEHTSDKWATDGNGKFFCTVCEPEVCEECGGTGEVTTMERVYPNEPHMAPVGSEPCPACGGKGK